MVHGAIFCLFLVTLHKVEPLNNVIGQEMSVSDSSDTDIPLPLLNWLNLCTLGPSEY